MRKHQACPCLHTTPCHPRCTCVNPVSSVGCRRCCSYGSKAQQVAQGERLARLHADNDRLRMSLQTLWINAQELADWSKPLKDNILKALGLGADPEPPHE